LNTEAALWVDGFAVTLTVVQSVLGVGADADEDISEISERIDAKPFAGGNQTREHSAGAPAVITAIEHPVAASYHDSSTR
jgi:hypothetical protein